MRETHWRGKEGEETRARLGQKNLGIWKRRKRKRRRKEKRNSRKLRLEDLHSERKQSWKRGWNFKIFCGIRGAELKTSAVKKPMASFAFLESDSNEFDWGVILILYFNYLVKMVNHYSCMFKLKVAQSIGQDYLENIKSQCYGITQRSFEACTAAMWRYQELGEVPSSSLKILYMHWWFFFGDNHYYLRKFPIYTVIWKSLLICFQVSHCLYNLCSKLCSCVTMNPQLAISSSRTRSRSTSPRRPFNHRRTLPREPSISHKGRFTFTMENNETRVSTTALASSVQSHFEAFCLVGRVLGVPVSGRAIRNRLKNDWKDLQEEVSVDHIGRDWYKIEFGAEEDVEFVLQHRPWFVQGQIFALQRWRLDFSPFHVSIDSIICWARIPFLSLHYKDPEVLSDLVSILGTLICIDQASMVGRQSMFVRVCLEVDLTKPLKRCLILGDDPKETRIYISVIRPYLEYVFIVARKMIRVMSALSRSPTKITSRWRG